MSTTYTSTIEVNVWKEHTCVRCGTVYRYLFQRTKQGQGATPDAAAAAAHNAVVEALTKEVDMQPCTGCGSYQPDMIASERSARHWWAFGIGIAPFLLIWILVISDVMAKSTGAYALAISAAVLLAWHFLVDAFNPNANLEANHRLAQDREQRRELWAPEGKKGEGNGQPVGSGYNTGHTVGYVMLVAALLLFLAPTAYAFAVGAKLNPNWNSEILGPGDEGYVYFSQSITSVKGYWNTQGPIVVNLVNSAELGLQGQPVNFQARANTSNWAGGISVSSKESKTSSPRLYAYVRLPNDERLIGKTLQLQISMNVQFPQLQGSNQFINVTNNFTHTAPLVVSASKAGSNFVGLWWIGFVAGLVLTLAGGMTLALASAAFREKALPTDIFVPGQDEGVPSGPPGGDEGRGPAARDEGEGRYRTSDDEGPRRKGRDDDY